MAHDSSRYPNLAQLDDALARGDLDDARQALLNLSVDERALLQDEMGGEALAASYRNARSRRRGAGLGRVILLPGLMGSELDSVDEDGDSDHVWVNYWRILRGRLKDLRLSATGTPLDTPPTVKVKAWSDLFTSRTVCKKNRFPTIFSDKDKTHRSVSGIPFNLRCCHFHR